MQFSSWSEWAKADDLLKLSALPAPIDAPPCICCRYWKPVVEFGSMGEYDGIKCCHADEQYADFSCYDPRQSEEAE